MLRQSLQQKLLQKLSPQQIQFIKLLQVPTVSLDARIKEELEENPALEDMSLADMNEPSEDYPDKDPEDKITNEEQTSDNEEFNVEEYLQDDDISNYSNFGTFSHDDDEDRKEMPIAVQNSFFENLNNQLNLLDLTEQEFLIGQQIVGSLDDDGYLRRSTSSLIDDLAFSQNIIATEQEVEEVLYKVQQFDPPGIAARDLQECLLIQLRKKDTESYVISKAIQIVENHLEEFTRKHYDKLERILGINSDELKNIIDEILKLNPKPGDSGSTLENLSTLYPIFTLVMMREF